jgi:hypothetical protein
MYLKAGQIYAAVRALYAKNGYTVLSEVRNGTGFSKAVRTADMLAISTWPSRGLYCEGFEIKSSRSDLARELATPEKADEIAKYCLYWWLAVPEGLVSEGMLVPPAWGVIEVNDKLKATVRVKAKALQPVPMDELFVCAVLRNFAESHIPLAEVEPKIEAARKEALANAKASAGARLKELEGAVAKFKAESGIDLLDQWGHPTWELGSIAEAVRLIVSMRGRPVQELLEAKQALLDGAAAINAALGPLGGNA